MFRLYFTIFICSICSSTALANQPSDPFNQLDFEKIISQVTGILGKKLFSESGSCSFNDFDLPGEGWYASGGTGGLAVTDSSFNIASAYPQTLATQLKELAKIESIKESVSIIIVDDFKGHVLTLENTNAILGEGVFALGQKTWPIDAKKRSKALRQEVFKLQREGQFSHGALVFNHTLALLKAVSDFKMDTSQLASDNKVVFWNPERSERIVVTAFDIGKVNRVDVHKITNELNNLLLKLYFNENINDNVVNMSYSLLPCSVFKDFRSKDYANFESYLAEVAEANKHLRGGYTKEELAGSIRKLVTYKTARDNEYVFDLIAHSARKKEAGVNNIFVAAAGNYSLEYSLYPAAWPEVISVSASDKTGQKASFTDNGKIMALGGWYTLTDSLENYEDNAQIVYAGSSFSAPVVTVFLALDLARSETSYLCGRELKKYVDDINLWRLPKLLQATGENVPLIRAVQETCDLPNN